MEYVGSDGDKHQPIMIHRALMGSLERFFGVLVEHYAGAFPPWLAPVQAVVVPVGKDFVPFACDVAARLDGMRIDVDDRDEKLGYKIREAQMQKIPYMLIVGGREVENDSVSVRSRTEGDLGAMSVDDFKRRISSEISERKNGGESA